MRTIPDTHIAVGPGPAGKMALMLHGLPGPVLVMYSAAQCSACNQLRPVLQRLESAHRGVAFVEVPNVTGRKRFAADSKRTATPITETPTLIMYADGQPVAVYTGQTRTVQAVNQFINDVMGHIMKAGLLGGGRGGGAAGGGGVNTGLAMPSTTEGASGVAHQPGGGYAVMGGVVGQEPNDGLWVPGNVKPHNQPWNGYKMFG